MRFAAAAGATDARWGMGRAVQDDATDADQPAELTSDESRSKNGGLMGQWPERVAVQPRAPGAIRRLQPLFRHPTPPQYPERVDI